MAPGELDLERFGELAERGRDALAAGNPDEAAALLREALGIWRGPPLADFAYEPFAQAVIAQLEELQLAAIEDRVEADLALGRARELVGELRDLVARHPLRERLRGQLMLALYRSGRQAEALEAYQEFRRSLGEELGLEPGPAIQQLELAILGREPALDLARAGQARQARRPAALARRSRASSSGLALAVGAAGLLILVLAGVVMAARAGRATQPQGIPGDAVGAISPSARAVRAVVPLGTSPRLWRLATPRCGWPTPTRGRCRGSTRARARSLRRSRWAHRRAGSRSVRARYGSPITTAARFADRPVGRSGRADDPGGQRAERGGGR